jgi:WS/DGAT/MGAT family acyltransferase
MMIGAVVTFTPQEKNQPSHPTRLAQLLTDRARAIPQLHKKIETSWLSFGGVRWVDDPDFQVGQHIHTHRLGKRELTDVASTIMAGRLDLSRPLWEVHLITGLSGGRFAIVAKLHHALADGAAAIMLSLGLLDGFPPAEPGPKAADPSLVDRLSDLPEQFRQARDTADITASVLRSARPIIQDSPLRARPSHRRALATARLAVADVKQVRARHGGTANDTLLAVLSGALREFLADRGNLVDNLTPRALIPVNQRRRDPASIGGNQLSGYLCDLPVHDRDPARRLASVRAAMDANKAAGPFRGPGALPVIANRVPAAVHRLATPLLGRSANLLFDTVITNVALPNVPLYFAGARLSEIYPMLPIAHGQALGVALCTYQDNVHIGLYANAGALPDIDQLGDAIPAALAALTGKRANAASTRADVAPKAMSR